MGVNEAFCCETECLHETAVDPLLEHTTNFCCAVVKSSACLELLLILSEEDVKGASKAPHGEHQEQQEPLDVSHHGAQSVNKSVLGWLKYPVPADSVSRAFRVYKEFTVRTLKSVQSHHGAEEYQQRPSWTAETPVTASTCNCYS